MNIKMLLAMYDTLINGGRVSRRGVCAQYGLSERTFYRYMREISAFLREYKSDCVIDLSRDGAEYFIKK